MCVRYIAKQWQSRQKHHVVESNITCLKYAHALAKANKMADSCTSDFNENSVALWGGCFTKKLYVLIKYFAVLRQSLGLLGQFATAWKNWSWRTNTTNYCNPAAHACQRLIIQWLLHIIYVCVQQLLLNTSHCNIAMTTKCRATVLCGFTTTTLPMFWLKKHQQLHKRKLSHFQ